jgi:hypothetical protein
MTNSEKLRATLKETNVAFVNAYVIGNNYHVEMKTEQSANALVNTFKRAGFIECELYNISGKWVASATSAKF